jgi:hypothetical protein
MTDLNSWRRMALECVPAASLVPGPGRDERTVSRDMKERATTCGVVKCYCRAPCRKTKQHFEMQQATPPAAQRRQGFPDKQIETGFSYQ